MAAAGEAVILAAFLADNGKNLPLAGRLPTAAFWPLPAAIAAPLIAWSLRRHGRRNQLLAPPRLPGRPTPRACAMPGNGTGPRLAV